MKYIKVLLFFLMGFGFGYYLNSLTFYNLGVVSFCNLTETDRIRICPSLRSMTEFEKGGEVITYICNDTTGYFEVKNLTPLSLKLIEKKIELYRKEGVVITEECDTKHGTVFKFYKGQNG
jgi:hypothetical protein